MSRESAAILLAPHGDLPYHAVMPRARRGRTGDSRALARALELFREWGRQGGRARAAKLSAKRRRELARKAVAARWAKAKRQPPSR